MSNTLLVGPHVDEQHVVGPHVGTARRDISADALQVRCAPRPLIHSPVECLVLPVKSRDALSANEREGDSF